MNLEYLSEIALNSFISLALAEDVGDGDHSSLACVPSDAKEKAVLISKDSGIVAGVNLAERIFLKIDPNFKINILKKDGQSISYGDKVLELEGNAQAILKGERLALNCLQRMSGIATYTHQLNQLIAGTGAKLLDTRKTTPNFRICEKWAVIIGGGVNHRYNLADMIMLKDNHVDYAGGIESAILRTVDYLKKTGRDLKIEIETRNLKEVEEAVKTGHVFRIMFDNMSVEDMVEAVKIVDGKYETEASGGITENTIKNIAQTGVNYISVGALTHSYKSLDLSLKAVK